MKEKINTEVLIIGSGPAGYTAAIYAARANLKPHLVSGLEPGGQLTITTDVENYPGYGDTIQGPWLMEEMKKQSLNVGTIIHNDMVTEVDFNSYPFISKTDSGLIFESKTVIISTGAQARWLGIKSEEKFKGYGISACATCDGFFFKDQKVAVIGGGNSAVEEALYLTNFASKVTLIHRRDELRAEKILQDRLFKNPKINVIWNKTVEEFIGNDKVEKIKVSKIKLGKPDSTGRNKPEIVQGSDFEIEADIVIKSLGFDPENLPKLFDNSNLSVSTWGTLKIDLKTMETNIPGVFAAGDIVRGASLVVWAIRDGRDVADSIKNFLQKNNKLDNKVA